jgi:hypothetical protein
MEYKFGPPTQNSVPSYPPPLQGVPEKHRRIVSQLCDLCLQICDAQKRSAKASLILYSERPSGPTAQDCQYDMIAIQRDAFGTQIQIPTCLDFLGAVYRFVVSLGRDSGTASLTTMSHSP